MMTDNIIMKQRNVKSYPQKFTIHFGNANQMFPPQWDDEMSDDDVVNYATGMFGQWPALLCMDDSHELLVLRDGRLETQQLAAVPK